MLSRHSFVLKNLIQHTLGTKHFLKGTLNLFVSDGVIVRYINIMNESSQCLNTLSPPWIFYYYFKILPLNTFSQSFLRGTNNLQHTHSNLLKFFYSLSLLLILFWHFLLLCSPLISHSPHLCRCDERYGSSQAITP